MKYPIDFEKCVAAPPPEFGLDEARQVILPFMTGAYRDGEAGTPGYPLDPAAEIAAFEAERGPLSSEYSRRFITALIECGNAAYQQGRAHAAVSFARTRT